MNRFLLACAAVSFCIFAGCATTGIGPDDSAEFKRIRISEKSTVSGCQFLGDIHGVSSLYGLQAAEGLTSARKAALNEALKLGATDIVWEQFSTPHGSTSVHGYAYRCSP